MDIDLMENDVLILINNRYTNTLLKLASYLLFINNINKIKTKINY